MRILVVDNYDSFTHNLCAQLAAQGVNVAVRQRDELHPANIAAHRPDAVLLSPGPGRPETLPGLARLAAWLVERYPVLGVCLGHQVLGHLSGGRITASPRIVHGKTSPVHHNGRGLFAGLPQPVHFMRYHSLCLDPAHPPAEFRLIARSADGGIMAIAHPDRPLWGIQFHPESILSIPHGDRLMANWLRLVQANRTPHDDPDHQNPRLLSVH